MTFNGSVGPTDRSTEALRNEIWYWEQDPKSDESQIQKLRWALWRIETATRAERKHLFSMFGRIESGDDCPCCNVALGLIASLEMSLGTSEFNRYVMSRRWNQNA